MNIERWAERQKAAMIDVGVHPLDAEIAVQWVVDNLPLGEDPNTWIPAQEFADSVMYGTLEDAITDAKATWYSHDAVPRRFVSILDAAAVDNEDGAREYKKEATVLALYLWLRNRRQYYRSDRMGDIPLRRLQSFLNNHTAANSRAMSEVVGGVYDGDIAYAAWLRHMQIELRRAGLQYQALGGGGWEQMTIRDYLNVDRKLVSDYNYLRAFAVAILAGEVSKLQADNRIDMYFGNARLNYFDAWSAEPVVPDEGMTWVDIRYLGDADHCDDCIIYWDMGFQQEGTLPRPHEQCECRAKCRCSLAGRQVLTSELAQWIGTRRDATGNLGANEPQREDVERITRQRKERNAKQRANGKDVPDWLSNRIADNTPDD